MESKKCYIVVYIGLSIDRELERSHPVHTVECIIEEELEESDVLLSGRWASLGDLMERHLRLIFYLVLYNVLPAIYGPYALSFGSHAV